MNSNRVSPSDAACSQLTHSSASLTDIIGKLDEQLAGAISNLRAETEGVQERLDAQEKQMDAILKQLVKPDTPARSTTTLKPRKRLREEPDGDESEGGMPYEPIPSIMRKRDLLTAHSAEMSEQTLIKLLNAKARAFNGALDSPDEPLHPLRSDNGKYTWGSETSIRTLSRLGSKFIHPIVCQVERVRRDPMLTHRHRKQPPEHSQRV